LWRRSKPFAGDGSASALVGDHELAGSAAHVVLVDAPKISVQAAAPAGRSPWADAAAIRPQPGISGERAMIEDKPPGERRSFRPTAHKSTQGSPTQESADGTVEYTLAGLLARYGRAESERVTAYTAAEDMAPFTRDGERISTARIVRDGARLLGQTGTFLTTATSAQREEVVMIDANFVTVAVTALADADEAQRELDTRKTAAASAQRMGQKRGATALGKAKGRRETLRQALLTAAGADPQWKAKVEDAVGTAETADEVADSIERQVKVGRALAAWVKSRGVACPLTDGYFDKALKVAADARATGATAEAPRVREGVRQGEVNRLDGVCLWFLKRLVDTFDAGHESDPTIPRLPVLSLRSVLRRGARPRKKTP
jgi:hypothetical protein